MDHTSNWRSFFHPEARRRIVIGISNTLKSGNYYLVDGDHDELLELQKIAQSVEQKSYAGATSHPDYFAKIASKMDSLHGARERDWRRHLIPGSRQRMVHNIVECIRTRLLANTVSTPEGSQAIWSAVENVEDRAFTNATDMDDYERRVITVWLRITECVDGPFGRPTTMEWTGVNGRPRRVLVVPRSQN